MLLEQSSEDLTTDTATVLKLRNTLQKPSQHILFISRQLLLFDILLRPQQIGIQLSQFIVPLDNPTIRTVFMLERARKFTRSIESSRYLFRRVVQLRTLPRVVIGSHWTRLLHMKRRQGGSRFEKS